MIEPLVYKAVKAEKKLEENFEAGGKTYLVRNVKEKTMLCQYRLVSVHGVVTMQIRRRRMIRKYIDKFFEGERDVAIPFTLIFGVLGIGIITCLAVIIVCIFGGGE